MLSEKLGVLSWFVWVRTVLCVFTYHLLSLSIWWFYVNQAIMELGTRWGVVMGGAFGGGFHPHLGQFWG